MPHQGITFFSFGAKRQRGSAPRRQKPPASLSARGAVSRAKCPSWPACGLTLDPWAPIPCRVRVAGWLGAQQYEVLGPCGLQRSDHTQTPLERRAWDSWERCILHPVKDCVCPSFAWISRLLLLLLETKSVVFPQPQSSTTKQGPRRVRPADRHRVQCAVKSLRDGPQSPTAQTCLTMPCHAMGRPPTPPRRREPPSSQDPWPQPAQV